MNVYYSNKVEKLFEGLKQELFHPSTTPFTKRYVIVPCPSMKNWLTSAIAEDADLGIAAGIQVTYIEPAAQEIIATLSDYPEQFPKKISEFELAIKLEIEIKKIMQTYPEMEAFEQVIWAPLLRYLLSVSSIPKYYIVTKKESRRILTLSAKLANLFITYGKYGSKMLHKWKGELSLEGEWQKELWKRLVHEVYPECYQWRTKNTTVHLFGLSFISLQQHQLFMSLSKVIPVHYYLLSPTLVYSEKQGVEEARNLSLEEYIYDRNPLLANLGRLGREMVLQIKNSDCIIQEQYALTENLKEIEAYRDLFSDAIDFSASKTSPSLLECLQADFLMIRKPARNGMIDLYNDRSIQLLMSSSPMREVQTLYDVLLNIIDKHSTSHDPILPEDIIVMAPDIIKYEPYIHAVFSQEKAKFDYQMMDLNLILRNPLVQGFFSLIELSESRWDVSSLLKLFENRLFQQRHGFSVEDMQKIKSWIEVADVRWGVDSAHRVELLKREFDEYCKMDETFSGTWKQGALRLLLGMVMVLPEGDAEEKSSISPLNIIETSEALLFSNWMSLVQSLKADLQPLTESIFLPMGEWSVYLRCLIESYFLQPKQNEQYDEETLNFLDSVSRLGLNKKYERETFSFSTVKYHLEQNLNGQRAGYRESHLHALRFCSMLPIGALPAKVVVLLGMSEDCYPKRDPSDSLNLLNKSVGCDYCPTQSELDRNLFLETLLSARQYYILSYCGYSEEDGKPQSASLLVSELFSYLDSRFRVDGKKPSEMCFKKTPFLAYDKSLFEEGVEIRSYSAMYYRAARAYYEKIRKLPAHCFVPEFKKGEIYSFKTLEKLDLRHLSQMAKNPIEAYLKHKHGMYLKLFEPGKNKNEEDFTLDVMQNAILRNSSVKRSLDSILHSAEKQGRLPLGPFKNFSIGKLRAEVAAIKQNFQDLQVDADAIFEIRFSDHHETVTRTDSGDFQVPPLECFCGGNKVKIIGTLPYISTSGMIVLSGDDKVDVLKIWPHYLAFLCAIKQFNLPFEDKLFFAKSKKPKTPFFDNPFPLFEKYLDYYHHSLENISPLIPEWVFDIMLSDSEKFAEKIDSTLSDRNPHFYNSYFKWILRGSKNPDHEVMMDNWKKNARELFEELFRNWYPSKKTFSQEVPS